MGGLGLPDAHEEPVSILLVDDRIENLIALEAVLEPMGHRLVRATSGTAALKALLVDEYAVILLDVQMPSLDGFETAAIIKRREKTSHVPIIFITAYGGDDTALFRAYESGAVDYLPKPFEPAVLRGKVSVFVDLYRLRRQAERLAYRALHDELTGLPNRTLLVDRLEAALARRARYGTDVAVLFVDLDGFKAVNDRFGHDVGDVLLTTLAERMRVALRSTDTLARFGGDEFVILCEDLTDDQDAVAIAKRVVASAADVVSVGEVDARVTASVGVCLVTDAALGPSALLRRADAAMYQAKDRGRDRFVVFEE